MSSLTHPPYHRFRRHGRTGRTADAGRKARLSFFGAGRQPSAVSLDGSGFGTMHQPPLPRPQPPACYSLHPALSRTPGSSGPWRRASNSGSNFRQSTAGSQEKGRELGYLKEVCVRGTDLLRYLPTYPRVGAVDAASDVRHECRDGRVAARSVPPQLPASPCSVWGVVALVLRLQPNPCQSVDLLIRAWDHFDAPARPLHTLRPHIPIRNLREPSPLATLIIHKFT